MSEEFGNGIAVLSDGFRIRAERQLNHVKFICQHYDAMRMKLHLKNEMVQPSKHFKSRHCVKIES